MSYDPKLLAEAGALVLDQQIPGWHNQIDLNILSMASWTLCVIGQLFYSKGGPWYEIGAKHLFGRLDYPELHNHGFYVDQEIIPVGAWINLTKCWKEEITKRRLAAGVCDEISCA